MGILDRGGDHQRGSGSFGVNLGHPIVTNGDFVMHLFRLFWRTLLYAAERTTEIMRLRNLT